MVPDDMPALLPRPQGAALARTGERRDLAQASPRRSRRSGGSSGEKQRQSPPRLAILPPPWDLPLPSFPPSLTPEVERRGARRRALRGPGKHNRSSGARGASRRIAWDSPLLQGREAPLLGERPVRFAPAPSVSSPASSSLSSAPASAGSRSPPLGELQTRKQPPPHPGQQPRAGRLQVHRTPARTPMPSAPRGRGAQPASRPCGWGAPAHAAAEPNARTSLRAPFSLSGSGARGRLGATPGASQQGKGSWTSAIQHLRHGRPAGAVVMMEILSSSFLGEVCLLAQRAGKVGSSGDRHGRDLISLFLYGVVPVPPSPARQGQKMFTHRLSPHTCG
ncbi:translation initiation factor IF-2-like [Sciurus carolinensis]|uniref:translation initiation factor IF-2-like n=1 Tax=Sciurus carolinensis TaxID=30640 RepID=UPI001FB35E3F|nr:translation initiation factor IF-2-like [Sciurus carolinensis]